MLVQFFEGWVVPCCRALAVTQPTVHLTSHQMLARPFTEGFVFEVAFVRRNILWYSPHHPLRRQQTSNRSMDVRGNTA